MNNRRLLPLTAALVGGLIAPAIVAGLLRSSGELRLKNVALSLQVLTPLVVGLAIFVWKAARLRSWRPFVEGARGISAGFLSGLMLGIGLRLAMRLVALAAGREPHFTLGGTLIIIMVGVVFGAVFGLLFAAMRQWFPGTTLAKGIGYGAVLLVLFWYPFFEDARGDLKNVLHPVVIGVATSIVSMLWIGYAFVMVILLGRFERHWPAGFVEAKSVTAPL